MEKLFSLSTGEQLILRDLLPDDSQRLFTFFSESFSESSKLRFGPHTFDLGTLQSICNSDSSGPFAYIVADVATGAIVGYFLFQRGYLPHDLPRLTSYPSFKENENACTFAPAVADRFQGKGLAGCVFPFLLSELRKGGFRTIILWGGVQKNNAIALAFYQKFGFQVLGEFEYYGANLDMMLVL